MRIRRAKLSDAKKISMLVRETLEKVNKKDYTKEQIKIIKDKNTVDEIKKKIKAVIGFCLFDKTKLVGVISLEGNMIGGLFIRYSLIGKGFGKKLLKYVENYAKKKKIKKIVLYSTPISHGFYKRFGYKTLRRYKGSSRGRYKFPVIKMEKKL